MFRKGLSRRGRWSHTGFRASFRLKRHVHHVVFGITLLSLVALAIWWTIFINNSIKLEYSYRHEILDLKVKSAALRLGMSPHRPVPGPLADEPALEVVATAAAGGRPYCAALEPGWSEWAVLPQSSTLQEIQRLFHRRRIMVIGEGALLGLLLLICCLMLYQLIRTQRQAAAGKREFWNRVTHEIKTPIAGLMAFLQTLKNQPMDRAELLPMVDLALRQVDRQRQLAENLLSGQQLEGQAAPVALVDLPLRPFLEEFIAGHGLHFWGARVSLSADLPADLRVTADPQALHVIADNLVDNALKYAGAKLDLRIEVCDRNGYCEIAFADNGPGFDPALSENIFEAYRRLPGELPGVSHGSGMGLFIARGLARAMGGDLKAESHGPGTGARFIIRLEKKGRR